MSMPSSAPTLIAPSPAATTADGRARTYEVRTLGCQMNVHDSERLSGSLESAGYVKAQQGDEADVIVINTCAVRDNAAGKLYGTLGHLKSRKDRHEGMQIAVGGCMAQMDKQAVIDKAPWVDVVFGTHNMGSLPNLLERARHNGEAELEILESCVEPADMEDLGELFWGLEHLGDIKLTGSYQLDQGDGRGHHTYTDDWHDMIVSCRGQYAVVAACGDTQFGRFISLGYVDGQEMMLARRYVADDDVRAAWRTPKDVLNGTDWGILEDGQESFDPEADGVLVAKLPWRVEPSKKR